MTEEQIDALAEKYGDYNPHTVCYSFNADRDCRYNIYDFVRAVSAAGAAAQPVAMPPLPATHYVCGVEGDGYSEDRLYCNSPAWDEEAMHKYAKDFARAVLAANQTRLQEQVEPLPVVAWRVDGAFFGHRDCIPSGLLPPAAHPIPLADHATAVARIEALTAQERRTFEAGIAWKERAEKFEAQVEALRQDAERYRWLRNDATVHSLHAEDAEGMRYFYEGLDAAIDAAMRDKGEFDPAVASPKQGEQQT